MLHPTAVHIVGTSAYTVGERTVGSTREGVVLVSTLAGGTFEAFNYFSPTISAPSGG